MPYLFIFWILFIERPPLNKSLIKEIYICKICKEIFKNVHQAECGCRYCLECLEKQWVFLILDQQIQEIKESVELPLTHPEYYEEMGIRPPKGKCLSISLFKRK